MLSILKSSTDPSVRGSKFTADMPANVVLSRTRAARKNCVSSCCSTGVEPHATTMRKAQPKITRRDIGTPPSAVSGANPGRFARSLLFFVLLSKPRDGDRAIVALDVDQLHTLCGASNRADIFCRHSQDFALLRNQHQLRVVGHLRDANDLAVALGRLDVDDADAA